MDRKTIPSPSTLSVGSSIVQFTIPKIRNTCGHGRAPRAAVSCAHRHPRSACAAPGAGHSPGGGSSCSRDGEQIPTLLPCELSGLSVSHNALFRYAYMQILYPILHLFPKQMSHQLLLKILRAGVFLVSLAGASIAFFYFRGTAFPYQGAARFQGLTIVCKCDR